MSKGKEISAGREMGQCGRAELVVVGGRQGTQVRSRSLNLLWGMELFSGDLTPRPAELSAAEILWDPHFHKK